MGLCREERHFSLLKWQHAAEKSSLKEVRMFRLFLVCMFPEFVIRLRYLGIAEFKFCEVVVSFLFA